jgi:glucose-6-phosphate 1-dehydrogenase
MQKLRTVSIPSQDATTVSPGDPCIMVLFGASGDLAKRLLMPALYNLSLDGLLPTQFAVVGTAKDELTTDSFRERMSKDIRTFNTRKDFNEKVWQDLCGRLYYLPADFADAAAFTRLRELVGQLDAQYQAKGNVLFYLAVPPAVFGLISANIGKAGFKDSSPHAPRGEDSGWRRIIVEKPFGTDLHSAVELNRQILSYWDESQVYRVDHYLGKETVQNILAFRFANGMFEPLWNRQYVDHIQFSVSESVSVEGRGGYYDRSGVLRDMIQNHMLQMLAYICMEPPGSFAADDIRDEKAKLLKAVRVFTQREVGENAVRGQYGSGKTAGGAEVPDYRLEPNVNPRSSTETYAAMRLFIDNWRWDGVPVYLRSGKALWKRGTEVVVQFKKPPDTLFRGTAVPKLAANRLIFHIQPDQGIESCFQAKTPGPRMQLQPVNMRFNYGDAFHAAPGTGYEVMIFSCMMGDATLFSRTDLVETAWRIAQPFLDAWPNQPAAFPNYSAGTWGPKAASDLIERDGRRWYEIVTREVLERVPLFKGGDPVFLNQISMALKPCVATTGAVIINKGDQGNEMFLICRGEVEVLDGQGKVMTTLREGDIFGEVALLLSEPRTATVRAKTMCDLFVLDKGDFGRILRDQQQFAAAIKKIALERYNRQVAVEQLIGQG